MWAALKKACVLAFGMALIVAVLLGISFYHRIKERYVTDLVTPWHHPPATGHHVFMGMKLPETRDCNLPLSGRVSIIPRVFPMPETSMVIYNRVSKSGSTTVQKIIASLKGLNQFTGRVSHIYDQRRIMNSEQVRHE